MVVQAYIPENEYGFLRRSADGAWMICTSTAETPAVEDTKFFGDLGRTEYRLIGIGDGKARIIRFADLHRHSHFSLKDSILKIGDIVNGTEYCGALTDHGNMYGFLEYYKAMKKAGKKPIIGMEAYMEDMDGKKTRRHVILLAKNAQGYKNLSQMASMAHNNFYYQPHVTWDLLNKYHDDIICLSACLAGVIPTALKEGNEAVARRAIERFLGLFGEDFYIELQNHGIYDEDRIRPQLISLAHEYGVKVVATTDTHYLSPEDKDAHEVMLCLRDQKTWDDPKRPRYDGEGYYLHNSEDMEKRFAGFPEALDNTLEIMDKCDVEIKLGEVYLPNYEIPKEFSSPQEYMNHIAEEGFQSRFAGTPHLTDPVYLARLKYEQDMIEQMGFAAYFIIVWDFINYARSINAYVGPGRGSAAGSMVAYCMGITDVDPIRYNLLFERFLNPERVSWPDIDTDIESHYRPQVIKYMRHKYGEQSVCRIITFGTEAARQAIKDVARVFGYPASFGAKWAGMVPNKPGTTLAAATEFGTPLAAEIASNPDAKRVVAFAKKIEGCKRHASTHACGVCVAPGRVFDYLPTTLLEDPETGEKVLTTQVTKEEVEELGLIKMDLLGLRNLDVLHSTICRAQQNLSPKEVLAEIGSSKDKVVYQDIPLNDRATYELLRKGYTGGVFQLEGHEITALIQNLLWDLDTIPDDKLEEVAFERIVAAVALYRPGPMDYIPDYLAGVRDPKTVRYDCPEEQSILASTYGVLVYQEQLIQIAQKLAGYTLGEADVIRKACGKKKVDLLEQEQTKFIYGNKADFDAGKTKHYIPGCVGNGIPAETAQEIWAKMKKFGEYAFNRSHAVCYAYIGYLTAYMSSHWPAEFFEGMLNTFGDTTGAIPKYLGMAHSRGIPTLLPDIQKSDYNFRGNKDGILFGLKGISGIKKTGSYLVIERTERGNFKNAQDLYMRMANRGTPLDKSAIEGLVYSGALASFSDNKAALLKHFEQIKDTYQNTAAQMAMGQTTLLGMDPTSTPMPTNVARMSESTELEHEAAVLGIYVSKHPTDLYTKAVEDHPDYMPLEQVAALTSETVTIKTMGLVREFRSFQTKTHDTMASFNLETKYASVPCLVFAKQYTDLVHFLTENAVICVQGGLTRDRKNEEQFQLIIRTATTPQIALDILDGSIVAEIHDQDQQKAILQFISEHPGNTPVTLQAHGRSFPLKGRVADSPFTREFFKKYAPT